MRWPWHHHAEDDSDRISADEALELSQRQHQRACERRLEFNSFTARVRRMREVNHLAESFDEVFGVGR